MFWFDRLNLKINGIVAIVFMEAASGDFGVHVAFLVRRRKILEAP
jgi:hypothetical protein